MRADLQTLAKPDRPSGTLIWFFKQESANWNWYTSRQQITEEKRGSCESNMELNLLLLKDDLTIKPCNAVLIWSALDSCCKNVPALVSQHNRPSARQTVMNQKSVCYYSKLTRRMGNALKGFLCANMSATVCLCCGLTTELLHEANVPMGVEGQSVWRDTQGVEEVGGSDALQGHNTLCTHRPHLLLRQTAVPQRKDVCQRHVLLCGHTSTAYTRFRHSLY